MQNIGSNATQHTAMRVQKTHHEYFGHRKNMSVFDLAGNEFLVYRITTPKAVEHSSNCRSQHLLHEGSGCAIDKRKLSPKARSSISDITGGGRGAKCYGHGPSSAAPPKTFSVPKNKIHHIFHAVCPPRRGWGSKGVTCALAIGFTSSRQYGWWRYKTDPSRTLYDSEGGSRNFPSGTSCSETAGSV